MSAESTRLEFLKLSTAGLAAGAVAESVPAWASLSSADPGEITVRVTDVKRFESASALAWRQRAAQPSAEIIALNPEKTLQEVLGFGAAFTDAACYVPSIALEFARDFVPLNYSIRRNWDLASAVPVLERVITRLSCTVSMKEHPIQT